MNIANKNDCKTLTRISDAGIDKGTKVAEQIEVL
jgi:hypothetical protein